MNFFVFCVCMFNSATKLESPSSARAIIASLEEGSSTSLFPEKSQGNPTTMQDSSETTQDDSSNERPVTAGSCPFFLSRDVSVETTSSLPFFLVRRAKSARHANDHARDRRRETSFFSGWQ